MKIAVVPASTRTGTAAIQSLLSLSSPDDPIKVKAYYRDMSKAPSDFAIHADVELVQADVLDVSTLDFEGCDAVLAIPPPFFAFEDMVSRTEKAAENVKKAIEKAGSVKRLVLLSSQGAHLYEGVVCSQLMAAPLWSYANAEFRERSRQRLRQRESSGTLRSPGSRSSVPPTSWRTGLAP